MQAHELYSSQLPSLSLPKPWNFTAPSQDSKEAHADFWNSFPRWRPSLCSSGLQTSSSFNPPGFRSLSPPLSKTIVFYVGPPLLVHAGQRPPGRKSWPLRGRPSSRDCSPSPTLPVGQSPKNSCLLYVVQFPSCSRLIPGAVIQSWSGDGGSETAFLKESGDCFQVIARAFP